jgi:DNA-binding NarL/FixJ family response regulator
MTHWTNLARALLAEASAGPAAALEALLPAWEAAVQVGTIIVYPQLAPDLIRLAHAGADRGRAVEACELVEALAAANPEVATIRGIALRCRGLLKGDTEVLVEAASVLRDSPRPLERARAAEDAAVALVRRRHVAKALDFLDEALRGYRELAAEWDVARATSRMRAAGVHRDGGEVRHRPASGYEALTPSERAVVELVGERLSNAEVAERLFLSVHTVKRHLANARLKLGPASRADLARGGRPEA